MRSDQPYRAGIVHGEQKRGHGSTLGPLELENVELHVAAGSLVC